MRAPLKFAVHSTARSPCSCPSGTSISRVVLASIEISAADNGLYVSTGEVEPNSEPIATLALQPSPWMVSGRCWSKCGATKRCFSGKAYQSCTPWSTVVSRVECSRSEEHTSELQSRGHLVCRLLLEKKKT